MRVATDKRVLKKRLDRFIWESGKPRSVALRRSLRDDFMALGRTAVVGGMVRDFARRGAVGFASDVDLVIDAPLEKIAAFAVARKAESNRFGGYSLTMGSWKIDFWALGATWGSRQGHTNVESLEDVTKCTFFDCDAAIYDLENRSVHCAEQYLDRMRDSIIEINLLPTPSINGNLIRAVRRMLLWNFQPGPRLTEFIHAHLNDASFPEIASVDRKVYGDALIARSATATNLKRLLLGKDERREMGTYFAIQLPLPVVTDAAQFVSPAPIAGCHENN